MGACNTSEHRPIDSTTDAPVPRPVQTTASPAVVPHEMVDVSPRVIKAAKEAAEAELTKESASRRCSVHEPKVLRIGDEAPNFECDSTIGRFNWHQYIQGNWAILFSHPRDFTPICTTEIGMLANLEEEYTKRGVKLAVVSVDDAESHKQWVDEINSINKNEVKFPLLGDENKKIAVLYGMLDQTHLDSQGMPLTVRSVFIVGPDKKIKLILTYPATCGRNFFEILRCVDSLKLTAAAPCATPANWSPGDKVCLVPTLSDEQAAVFPGLQVPSARCKLRMVDQPQIE